MTSHSDAYDAHAIEPHIRTELLAEHAEIELLANNLLVAFASGSGPQLLGPWRRFEEGMGHHFAVEEAELFPALERVAPSAARALRATHLSLREQANAIALRIELGIARQHELEKLIDDLQEHGLEEDRLFGRWISAPATSGRPR